MDPDKRILILRSHISRMPPLSPTVTKVLTLCGRVDATASDLNKIISIDPVLMGKVLQLINSAYYGMPQKVTSLVRAIILLGINTIKNMLLSTAILGKLSQKRDFQALEIVEFWKHSLAVGVTAKLIAAKHGIPQDELEGYFIAGLLHDIGKIPLNNKYAKEYLEVLNLSENNHQSLVISENLALGTDHARVGKLIAENWNLGDEITDTITHHHDAGEYSGDNQGLVYVVTLADYLVNTLEIGYSGNAFPTQIDPEVLAFLGSRLNISYERLRGVVKNINEEIDKAKIFLSISG